MKTKALVFVSLILVVAIFASPGLMPTATAQDVSDVQVLMLITESFGWNYFDAKEILESWGVSVSTIAYALDTNVSGCVNKPDSFAIADYLIQDIEFSMVREFDALFIPSGGHWSGLISSTMVKDFIEYAHTNGVLIATTCIGNRVVAEANGIVNGTSVVNYVIHDTDEHMTEAGAILRYGLEAVIDNQIVTGAGGGGVSGGGYLQAPTSEICAAMVREALDYSYVVQGSVLPTTAESGTTFDISVVVTDLDTELGSLFSVDVNISEVQARIYTAENRTLVDTIELTDPEGDWTYEGEFTGDIEGYYVVDFEVEDTNSSLEVEREVAGFTVGVEPTTTTTSGTDTTDLILDPILVGGMLVSGLVVLVIVVVLRKRYT